MNQCIDLFNEEHTAIAASIIPPLRGGHNRHMGILMKTAEHMATFGISVPFQVTDNPRVYPTGPFPGGTQKEDEAEHDKKIEVCKVYLDLRH
jgi:hypothetical protein